MFPAQAAIIVNPESTRVKRAQPPLVPTARVASLNIPLDNRAAIPARAGSAVPVDNRIAPPAPPEILEIRQALPVPKHTLRLSADSSLPLLCLPGCFSNSRGFKIKQYKSWRARIRRATTTATLTTQPTMLSSVRTPLSMACQAHQQCCRQPTCQL